MRQDSGIGVLDKAIDVLDAVSLEPMSLAELVTNTGLPRATAHRLAVALEVHGLLERNVSGQFVLGYQLAAWAARRPDPLVSASGEVLAWLRDESGESSQVYRRDGRDRVCVAAAERPHGLRTAVAVGSRLPMTAGSGAQVLLAWSPDALPAEVTFSPRALAEVRRRGWAQSIAQREA